MHELQPSPAGADCPGMQGTGRALVPAVPVPLVPADGIPVVPAVG
jgi:hypothetical protein